MNIKKPWNEFRSVNTIWNVGAAFIMVSAPKIQVRPKRMITLMIFVINWIGMSLLWSGHLIAWLTCLISTAITTIKMTALKASIRRIGPKNAAKNTVTLLMKQLWKQRSRFNCSGTVQSQWTYYPSDALRLISKFRSIANGIMTGTNGVTVGLKSELKEHDNGWPLAYPNIWETEWQ